MDERVIAYFQGELSKQERIELLREAQTDHELKKSLSSFQNILALSELAPEAIKTSAGEEGLRRLMRKRKQRKIGRFIRLSVGYAAAAVLLVAATWFVATSSLEPAKQTEGVLQELFVPAGQRARINLPDGSIAWLNAGSTLSYPSVFGDERRVKLTGEGYFEVAKQTEKPFIVSTQQVDIKALGTQFNVYSYAKASYMNATLIEGSIKVYKSGEETSGAVLKPNEQYVYENGKFQIIPFTDKDKMLWKEGIYSFTKEPFGSIIKKLELYYDVEIIVKDPSILQFEYTGKFRQRDGVTEILRIIRKIHAFKMEKDENQNKITLSK